MSYAVVDWNASRTHLHDNTNIAASVTCVYLLVSKR